MGGGQHRGGPTCCVNSHRPREGPEWHGTTRLSAQHKPHRPSTGLDSLGEGASQCRFANAAVTDQRDAVTLRGAVECRQRATKLVAASHYRPLRPAFGLHRTHPAFSYYTITTYCSGAKLVSGKIDSDKTQLGFS